MANVSDTLKSLAKAPRMHAMSFVGFIVNGQRFHTREVERSTQDSGVFIEAETVCRSSAKDNAAVVGNVSYYGVIKDIILLDYRTFQMPIFHCDWANTINGVKQDDGFTLVNLHQGQNQWQIDPFILASQAKKVFYSRESDTSNWYVVLKATPRGYHNLNMYDENVNSTNMPIDASRLEPNDVDGNDPHVRKDSEEIEIEI